MTGTGPGNGADHDRPSVRVLLVDDDPIQAFNLEGLLGADRRRRFELRHAGSLTDGLSALAREHIDVVLLDLGLPDAEGTAAFTTVHARFPDLPIVVFTGLDDEATGESLVQAGAQDYLAKDRTTPDVVTRALLYAIERKRAQRALSVAQEREVRAQRREVEIADRIQQMLLMGAPPKVPGVTIAARTIPSRGIDGDFYDFLPRSGNCFDVVVVDVMGKGIPAALIAAAVKSQLLRTLPLGITTSDQATPSPAEIMQYVDEALTRQLQDLESYLTCVYARFETERHRVRLVDSGHPQPLLLRRDTERFEILEIDTHPPLGLLPGIPYAEHHLPVMPGDTLLFYSDGLTDARAPDGEFFGFDRVLDLAPVIAGKSPDEALAAILHAVRTFTQADQYADDLTCVVVRIDV